MQKLDKINRITLVDGSQSKNLQVPTGTKLIDLIRENSSNYSAPCGGNGICGKCKVKIVGEGEVNSCNYTIKSDIEVTIPSNIKQEEAITEYQHTLDLPTQRSTALWGVAIDLGTTTVVLHLVDLIGGDIKESRGASNPQSQFGADIISRINHSTKEGGLKQLQEAIITGLNDEISKFNIDLDQISKISIAGNTTMLHIIAGVDPISIALYPFKPKFLDRKKFLASTIGLNVGKDTTVELLPSLSANIGSDIVAGIASLAPPKHIKNYLFIDIGTNGEMAIVTPTRSWFCSAAAGPAFEGASISCGSGAVEGAIRRYKDGEISTVYNSKPSSICGSGLIDIISHMLKSKVILSDGELESNFKIEGTDLYISPQDAREVQLAKSAIYTGIKLLIKNSSIEIDQIDALFLAGGFGNYLNPKSAVEVGILPKELQAKIIPVGNSSGAGAILDLKSDLFNQLMDSVIEKAEVIDLSTDDQFEFEFAMNMFF